MTLNCDLRIVTEPSDGTYIYANVLLGDMVVHQWAFAASVIKTEERAAEKALERLKDGLGILLGMEALNRQREDEPDET